MKIRTNGRHRSTSGLPVFIVLGTIVAVLWVLIWAAFALQEQPQQMAPMQYVPSSAPSVPQPRVFPPVKTIPAPVRVYPAAGGDSLWSIARKECGNGTDWKRLARANQIWWPWRVKIGKVITLDCS